MIGIYYEKYIKSLGFTDKELNDAIKEFTQLESLLGEMGQRFQFAWRESYDILNGLTDMKKARGIK